MQRLTLLLIEMSRTYVYLMDTFTELNLSFEELAEIFEKDKMKPFEIVKDSIKKYLGEIKGADLYSSYFNPKTLTSVIEYLVESKVGKVSVKIIHAESIERGLKEYYEAEEKGEIRYY